ncbi:MAG: purine-nucleoside phosphorylase [Planctomycetota bacterium]
MSVAFESVSEAAAFLRDRGPAPRVWIILGTGLGALADKIAGAVTVPYGDIPHFPRSTAPGHAGDLLLGELAGVPVAVMQGRFHVYEGYSFSDIVLPVYVAKALGAERLFVTSAVGGMNPDLEKGDIVCIDDHINLTGDSPLTGPNDERLGPRFPDMSEPYDRALIETAMVEARKLGFSVPRAVLAAVPGPQLETRAEYRWLRQIGADVVGMSTIPEAIAAVHAGLLASAFSVVTDVCDPDALQPVNVEEIIAVANESAPRLESLLLALLSGLGDAS